VQISFPDLSSVPADQSVTLTDLETGKTLNMRTSTAYGYKSGAEGGTRRFRIEVAPRGAGTVLLTGAVAQQVADGTQLTYTLSAPATVGVNVVNIAGRPIAQMTPGYQEAGTHTVRWSGRDSRGLRVPAGRYLLLITCAADDGTQTTRTVSTQVR